MNKILEDAIIIRSIKVSSYEEISEIRIFRCQKFDGLRHILGALKFSLLHFVIKVSIENGERGTCLLKWMDH